MQQRDKTLLSNPLPHSKKNCMRGKSSKYTTLINLGLSLSLILYSSKKITILISFKTIPDA